MSALADLQKISFEQINLPGHSYRWAVIKGFTWGADVCSDLDLIAALLAHPAFKDHYCAPGEEGVGDEPLHGSYRLDALSPATFTPVGGEEGLILLDAWLAESGPEAPDPAEVAAVVSVLAPVQALIRHGDAVYYLPDLGPAAQHEWGWVLWHFREWLVIDRPGHRLHLISCGLD